MAQKIKNYFCKVILITPCMCPSRIFICSLFFWLVTRGGVEDTRLEAKAKDTKKIRSQGQGQPFQGQTLSKPRAGMLEAKAKDTSASALQKKKGLQKIFQAISKKKKIFTKILLAISPPKKSKGLYKNFSSDLHKKTFSKKFFKRSTKF